MLEITRLLDMDESKEIETDEFYAIELLPHEACNMIKKISKITRVNDFLKRIKKQNKFLLLMLQNKKTPLSDELLQIIEGRSLLIVDVPSTQPFTFDQYKIANNIWPCYFHPKQHETIKNVNFLELIYDEMRKIKEINTKCSNFCIIYDPNVNKILAKETDGNIFFEHAIFKAVEKVSISKRGYLCTNYEAILLFEPCIGCAMALVHGRIKRVFFLFSKENCELSFTTHKICYNKSLNHRYDVYKLSKKE